MLDCSMEREAKMNITKNKLIQWALYADNMLHQGMIPVTFDEYKEFDKQDELLKKQNEEVDSH